MKSKILYLTYFSLQTDENKYCAQICEVFSKKQLLEELSYTLNFPYFGFNWNALYDLFCDFHWINQTDIYIFHYGISKMPRKDIDEYLKLVKDSCNDWNNNLRHNENHNVFFIFNESDKYLLDPFFNSIEIIYK